MTLQPLELEGTWEEIVIRAPELAGRRVRLIVQGLIQANFKLGLLSFNPELIRKAIDMWWYDAGADALRDEYRNYTTRGLRAESINELDSSKIQKGDMAVTVDGEHILAYTGNMTWIEADPGYMKVVKVTIPEPSNPWFNVPIYVLRWRQFETEREDSIWLKN